MQRWFISDTHFSHANIIKYTARPYPNVEEMNQALIQNWNDAIADEGLVYFLGDFGMGSIEHLQSICAKLKGHKVCIRGNHDRSPLIMSRIGFTVVLEKAVIKIGRHFVELIHIPSDPPPSYFQVHGHVHEKRPAQLIDNQINLSVEVWDYKPVPEATLLSIFDKHKGNSPD